MFSVTVFGFTGPETKTGALTLEVSKLIPFFQVFSKGVTPLSSRFPSHHLRHSFRIEDRTPFSPPT